MKLHNFAKSQLMLEKYPFMSLIQPTGGIIQTVGTLNPLELNVPRFKTAGANLGNLSIAFPNLMDNFGHDLDSASIGGAGADEHTELAVVRAVAEAAERYATCVFDEKEMVVASSNELGVDAIDFRSIPACSAQEYADPLCPVKPFDPNAPIRWVWGYSAIDKKRRLVPSVMVYLFMREWESESFWQPITTGVAAHTNYIEAALSAICEVVERDAIAMTWLMKLPLKKIIIDDLPQEHLCKFERLKNSNIKQYFFDATSDIGIPTVYGLQLKDGNPTASQFVNCSTGFSTADNCAKIIRESACGRSVLERSHTIPNDYRDFAALEHGAAYMGRPEHRNAYDFLVNSDRFINLSDIKNPFVGSLEQRLNAVLERFRSLNMDVVLVDLTTDELRKAGLWVIRAVIPALMPLTFSYRARYLGHQRLYNYPESANFGVMTENDVNTYPQPFA